MFEPTPEIGGPNDGGLPPIDPGRKDVVNPETVNAINRWLKLQGGWGSGKPIEDYTQFAPEGITKADLKAVVLDMKPLGTANEDYDSRAYYITALADKILREEFKYKFPEGASPVEEAKFWNEEAVIELIRPKTGKYDKFRNFGTYWTRGTLVLNGDFGRDRDIGWGMNGGKIIVEGNVGEGVGTFMNGGIIEVKGHTGERKGYGAKGGEIIIHGKDFPKEDSLQLPESETPTKDYDYGDLTPADLARSWVEYQGAKITGEIENTKKDLERKQNTKRPAKPVTPDWVDPGSIDAQDWEAVQYEYEQWPQSHQEHLEYLRESLTELEEKGKALKEDYSRINEGNSDLIDKYSKLEAERRVSVENDRQRREAEIVERAEKEIAAKAEIEMEGADDMEKDLKQLYNLAKEGLLPENLQSIGWVVGNWDSKTSGIILGFYNGTERSGRTPSVRMEIDKLQNGGFNIEVKDWRNAWPAENHPFNNRGKGRIGKFYSTRVHDGVLSYRRAGDLVDDSEEFPREENLATREGFGQAQMYALKDIVNEAVSDLVKSDGI